MNLSKNNSFNFEAIGHFHTIEDEKYLLPKQPDCGKTNAGKIILLPNHNFEQALDDLKGFDRIWIIFAFHKNTHWKPKVLTPHGIPKRGVFATRSPYRPNNIGLSCLELVDIQGLSLFISNHDLLNGTPILDIKPYIPYADSFSEAKAGWLDTQKHTEFFSFTWEEKAKTQKAFLKNVYQLDLEDVLTFQLSKTPFPTSNNRIKDLGSEKYIIAIKTWRFVYKIENKNIHILEIQSGYDIETLSGIKQSKWNDVYIHQNFLKKFITK